MRKIITSVVLLVILILVFGPLAAGFGFQASYRDLLAFYNSQKNIHIKIVDYQRGWMSSEIKLSIEVDKKQLENALKIFDIPIVDANQPYQFVVKQHVQHGPIIYSKNAPSVFGLAAIQNKIEVMPDITSLFLLLGMPHVTLKSDEDFVTLMGNYFNHLEVSGLQVIDPVSRVHVQFDNFVSDVWIQPKQKRVSGILALSQFSIYNSDDSIEIDKINLKFDHHLDQYGLWLGTHSIAMPKLTVQEAGDEFLEINGLKLSSESHETAGMLSGLKTLDVNKINYDGEIVGPMHLELSAYKLNAKAMQNLIDASQEVAKNGEEYQGQLKQKISMILPKVIMPGTGINIDQFNLGTHTGKLTLNATVNWPERDFEAPSNVRDIVTTAKAQATLSISKKLMDDVIGIISGMPTSIREASSPDHDLLLSVRDQMEAAAKQNTYLIKILVESDELPEKSGEEFLDMQRDLVSVDDYEKAIKELFLTRKISPSVSYQLSWQYSQLRNPYQFLLRKVDEYQKSANDQLQGQLKELLNQGYIKEEKNEYVILFKWSEGKLTVNGRAVK
jgi:uncharacterized protein YdgA (DUF945 family)